MVSVAPLQRTFVPTVLEISDPHCAQKGLGSSAYIECFKHHSLKDHKDAFGIVEAFLIAARCLFEKSGTMRH